MSNHQESLGDLEKILLLVQCGRTGVDVAELQIKALLCPVGDSEEDIEPLLTMGLPEGNWVDTSNVPITPVSGNESLLSPPLNQTIVTCF